MINLRDVIPEEYWGRVLVRGNYVINYRLKTFNINTYGLSKKYIKLIIFILRKYPSIKIRFEVTTKYIELDLYFNEFYVIPKAFNIYKFGKTYVTLKRFEPEDLKIKVMHNVSEHI